MESNGDQPGSSKGRRGGGRGRFFRGRWNWYNKRGSRGRGKPGNHNGENTRPALDTEDGLRDRSIDCDDEVPSDDSRPARKRKNNSSSGPHHKRTENRSSADSEPERRRQPRIASALRAQWGEKYIGYNMYFQTDPMILNFEEKLDAARDYLLRNDFKDNESKVLELEEKECYDVKYLDVVGDDIFSEAWSSFPSELQHSPKEVLSIFGLATHRIVSEAVSKVEAENSNICEDDGGKSKWKLVIPYIRFGIMRVDPVTPLKSIKANFLSKYVTVRGAIVRTGTVKSHCIRQTFRCLRCRQTFGVDQPEGRYTVPTCCKASEDCDNKKEFEPVLGAATTKVIDYRRIRIQDVENSHLEQGRIPRTMDCDLFYDLVNHCNAGDIITLSGIVRMTRDSTGPTSDQSLHNLYIEVYALKSHKDSERTMGGHWFSFSNKDYYAVKEIFETEKLFRLLTASLCPSIFGLELVKAGVLLALFGGTLHSGELLERRSDINVLLVGDPGLGKSQMLKMVSEVTPRGVYVCGTGSTTAGLTVTLVRDGDEYSLEAGALVMADRGVCCIDEFDKMQSQHNALLEAMEQQCVSIAKAGVFRTIPARTSVVAAANPYGGHYDNSKSVSENIRISAPLLSRFDLIFVLQDRPDQDHDRNMVQHITGFRRARDAQPVASGSGANVERAEDSLAERLKFGVDEEIDVIPHQLLRKYIAYAKQYVNPKISPEAAQVLKEHYLNLRKNHRHLDATPVTTRQLESLVRLTEARAKAELREMATEEDARDVLEIFDYSMRGVYENDRDVTLGFTQEIMDTSMRSLSRTPSEIRSLSKNMAKRLAGALEKYSRGMSKTVFTVEEIKEVAKTVKIDNGVEKLIDVLNNGGHLLKKGSRVYEFMCGDS